MRLGGQTCAMQPGSLSARVYGSDEIVERHRHRFEFNNNYTNRLTEAGLVISARSSEPLGVHAGNSTSESGKGAGYDAEGLVEMIELPDHPWFIGCQFHPEYTSNPRDGHPLFTGFITAALEFQSNRLATETGEAQTAEIG